MPVTGSSIEVIPDLLRFVCGWSPGSNTHDLSISADADLQYTAFFADFGPLNLGLTVRFCQRLDRLILQAEQQRGTRGGGGIGGKEKETLAGPVVCYCADHPHRRANTAVLLCAYLIIFRRLSLEDAYAPFFDASPPFFAFRDAAFGINTFGLTVLDCARAMHRAVSVGHFRIDAFSVDDYERLAKLEHGDISWIVPGKFIAFSGPLSNRRELSPGVFSLLPQDYVKIFQRMGVSCVIRFNNKCYDRKVFTRAGIRHVDLFYEDGGNPTDAILQSFLQICEHETGAIAVHCKAGLGRTGTNIAAYLIKHYGYSARESIAWCRICRPGSVVGPQQQYLVSMESRLRGAATTSWGSLSATNSADVDSISLDLRKKCSVSSTGSSSGAGTGLEAPRPASSALGVRSHAGAASPFAPSSSTPSGAKTSSRPITSTGARISSARRSLGI